MEYYIDVSYESINKFGEELCGDKVEIIEKEEGTIIVLADGLGSGVKANIFSTLTSKIAASMMDGGADINETVDTIVNTLPVCSVRKIAYSTFTIIFIYNDGRVYIAEYDNPPFYLIKNSGQFNIKKKKSIINNKQILESNFVLEENDVLIVTSDGVVHAGIGQSLKMGWQWQNVNSYLNKNVKLEHSSKNICDSIINMCQFFYKNKPGDDTTVVSVKLNKKKEINIFTGPPKDKSMDKKVINEFMNLPGLKVVCGGTAATIVSRELNKNIEVLEDTMTEQIPPIAIIDGIDLVTEGVLTLSYTLEKLQEYYDNTLEKKSIQYNNDAASILAKLLIENGTHIRFWVGKAVNSAHQNPNLPFDLSIKLKIVEKISDLLQKLGKISEINYLEVGGRLNE